jgi:hypothetical protein
LIRNKFITLTRFKPTDPALKETNSTVIELSVLKLINVYSLSSSLLDPSILSKEIPEFSNYSYIILSMPSH